MVWILSRYPTIPACVVALCGIALIILGVVYPKGSLPHGSPTLAELQQKHHMAWAELLRSGVAGNVSSMDFSDGLGLALDQAVEADEVVLTIPESLAISVDRPRSCVHPQDMKAGFWRARSTWTGRGFWPDSPNLACEVERRVVADVARKKASRLTGVLALLVVEWLAAKGLIASTPAAPEVLQVLPDLSWQLENGLFALDAEELRVLGAGTSLASWRAVAENETQTALEYISFELEPQLGTSCTLQHVRWAYLLVHGYGQSEGPGAPALELELPSHVWFLWPLFLARPTPEAPDAALLRHNKVEQVYEVVVPRAMQQGEELRSLDLRLTDASALCFRGVWLTAKHRGQLKLPLPWAKNLAMMQRYGCTAPNSQTLNLIVALADEVDPTFLSCMRMAVLEPEEMLKLEARGWFAHWPRTLPYQQRTEHAAAQLAVELLQKALDRLSQWSGELRQGFGADSVVQRPTVRVREVETMLLLSLLKSMKELLLLSGNEYLYENLLELQRAALRPATCPARP